jgi:hypothetical protein
MLGSAAPNAICRISAGSDTSIAEKHGKRTQQSTRLQ